jgi:GH25 family lysozyme M1 (1,4-beta-N-acetylmuramidase)/uncharacterized protein YjdB
MKGFTWKSKKKAQYKHNDEYYWEDDVWETEDGTGVEAESSANIIETDAQASEYASREWYETNEANDEELNYEEDITYAEGAYEEDTTYEAGVEYGDGTAYEAEVEYGDSTAYESEVEYGDGTAYEVEVEYGDGTAYESEVEYGDGTAYESEAEYGDGTAYESEVVYGDGTAYEVDVEYGDGTAYEAEVEYGDGTAYEAGVEYGDGTAYEAEAEYGDGTAYESEVEYGVGTAYEAEVEYGDDAVYETEGEYGDGASYGEEGIYTADSEYAGYETGGEYGVYTDDTEGTVYEWDEAYEDSMAYEEEDTYNPTLFGRITQYLREMGIVDKVLMGAGMLILTVGIITGISILSVRMVQEQVEDFTAVGSQLANIDVIGGSGLLAVADAKMAKIAAANAVASMEEEEEEVEEEEEEGYTEEEYNRHVTIALNMVSIQKDLKIKFINADNDKLVANIPFKVLVTIPSGATTDWSDDDMDGIIYKKGLEPGTYKIELQKLEGSAYEDYTFPGQAISAEVKKEVAYKKVDIGNEIKKESEVNAAKEDTEKKDTTVESTLTDSVTWVESTAVATTYTEVNKANIPDPLALVWTGRFMRLAQVQIEEGQDPNPTASISASTKSIKVGDAPVTLSAVIEPDSGTVGSFTWTSSNPSAATVSSYGSATATVTAVAPGITNITFSVGVDHQVSGGNATRTTTLTGTCTVTVTDSLTAGTITLAPSPITMAKGTAGTVQITPANFTQGKTLTYSVVSNRSDIATATVAADGKITVTAVAVGEAIITATANYTSPDTPLVTPAMATVTVKVLDQKAITLDKSALTVYMETTQKLTATLVNNLTSDPQLIVASSDTNVAEVTVSGKEITVTPKNPGSTTLTVSYTENNETIQVTCAITVKPHPRSDIATLLKDKDGNQLYVLENDQYREAHYADYYTDSKFFIKGDPKYTGWQTLDGKVYYFDEAGNKVTGEQIIQGAKYNFASDGTLVVGTGSLGIDVSKWNGSIDWNAVKNSGISYVIIRCGYRGSSAGALIEDPKYRTNIKGAAAAGLKVGVYFFTQAVDVNEAVMEASMVLDLISGYTISYPVFLDVESSGGRADAIDKETRTAVCKAFCETIKASGYTSGIYANKNWLTTKIDAAQLSSYKIWLAQYAAAPTYSGRYDLWQYKSTGRVSGISGDVDLNLSYLGY